MFQTTPWQEAIKNKGSEPDHTFYQKIFYQQPKSEFLIGVVHTKKNHTYKFFSRKRLSVQLDLRTTDKTTPSWQGIPKSRYSQCQKYGVKLSVGQTLFTENFQQIDPLTTHFKYITFASERKLLWRRILNSLTTSTCSTLLIGRWFAATWRQYRFA